MKTSTLMLPLLALSLFAMGADAGGCGEGLDASELDDGQVTYREIGDVSGVVHDATTSQPVVGATVSVAGKSDTSDTAGAFFISEVTAGEQTLTVQAAGYEPFSTTVTVEQAANAVGILNIVPTGSGLDPCMASQSGDQKCDDAEIWSCDGTVWSFVEACTAPEICVADPTGAASCEESTTCGASGANRCSGTVLELCDGTTWAVVEDCLDRTPHHYCDEPSAGVAACQQPAILSLDARTDFDLDSIDDALDNCPFVGNLLQEDSDNDTVGDICDSCPTTASMTQGDIDSDGIGDVCDIDADGDGVDNLADNCIDDPNGAQINTDADSQGDACDDDDDNDGILDIDDDCRLGVAGVDICNDDADSDGIFSDVDNCPYIYNPQLDGNGNQLDLDADGVGDACDLDMDGDAVANYVDNCMGVYNPSQLDLDRDGLGDAGSWGAGAGSCDPMECYVIAGNAASCLDPITAFSVRVQLATEVFATGRPITAAVFSNRPDELHQWTASITGAPATSSATLENAEQQAHRLGNTVQIAACADPCTSRGDITLVPDVAGRYSLQIDVTLPGGDPLGLGTTIAGVGIDLDIIDL